MAFTRKSLADHLDSYDDEIAELQKSKRMMFDDYRAQLVGLGWGKQAIKAEVEGLKVAMRRRRAVRKAGDEAVEEADAIADEIFVEITRAPRATHARENIEEFDAETGEVFGDDVSAKLVATVATGLQTETGRKALVKALDIMIEREEAEERRSDLGLNILTKHEDIRTAPETALNSTAARMDVPSATAEDGRQLVGNEKCQDKREEASHRQAGTQALSVDAHPDQPLTGGDHEEVADSRAAQGEGAPSAALPAAGVTLEYVPATGVKRLPFAHCFPELSKADYERLEKDIAANRVQTPIIRQGDVIVDGWARYLISRQYGMSYPIQEYSGSDVLLDVIELQRASRNFTPAQEKKIAADLAKEFPLRADEIMAAFRLTDVLEAAE